MKVDIWMPIYIGDYLRDTQDLEDHEHGVYLLLLMHYWLKRGVIGSDVKRLSRVAKSTEENTKYILDNYFILKNGNYINNRSDEEMDAAESRRESARVNGKKGGRPLKNPQETHGLIEGIPTDNRAGNPQKTSSSSSSSSSLPSPTQSPTKEKEPPWNLGDVIKMFDFWNSKEILPSYPESKYKNGVNIPHIQELYSNLNCFSHTEISQSINNYADIITNRTKYECAEYNNALNFLIKGIQDYYDKAKPFDRCLKKGKKKEADYIPVNVKREFTT